MKLEWYVNGGSRHRRGMAALLFVAASAAAGQARGQNYIGVGVGVRPEYEGAKDYHAVPVPLVNYQTDHFFIAPRGGWPSLGFKAVLGNDFSTGLFLGAEMGRDSSDSDRLKGLDDIDFHGVYGAYLSWDPGRFSLSAAYGQATRSGYGGKLDLRASYRLLKTTRDTVSVGVGTQWASHDAMQTWFGITSDQSAHSHEGLSPYSPSAGFKSAALFGSWRHSFNRDWGLVTTLGVSTLLGDARDSPVVERKTGVFGTVGVTYAF